MSGPVMSFNKLIQVCGGFPLADQSAVAAINRALRGCRVRSPYPCYFVHLHYRAQRRFIGFVCLMTMARLADNEI